jgi:hypothetical protein
MDGVTGGQVFEGDALEGHGSRWIRGGCLGSLSRGDKTGLFWLFWLLWMSWLPCHEGRFPGIEAPAVRVEEVEERSRSALLD